MQPARAQQSFGSGSKVYASDISIEQVNQAPRRSNIVYLVESAEQTSFPSDTFDLVTVAQALHWFDYSKFWTKVSRVSKEGGFFCAWGYAWFDCDPDADRLLVRPIRKLLEPFWASSNGILWRGYRSEEVYFPFERIDAPRLFIDVKWTVPQIIAYMQTWSAYKRGLQNVDVAKSLDATIANALKALPHQSPTHVVMPLSIIAGRVTRQ